MSAQSSTGTQAFTANNTYTGGTTVSAGTLYINNGGGASYSAPATSTHAAIMATNTSGSGTGTGLVTVSSGGTLAGSGTIAPTSGGVTVNNGGTLISGGIQSGTTAGVGLTLNNSSSSLLSVIGGGTLSFALGSTDSTGAAGSGGANNFANPNTNSTYLSLADPTSDLIFSNTTTADNIALVDLTAGSSSVTLTLRYSNPYLLIQTALGNDNDFANLVTNNGTGVNGYVLGVSNGTGSYTPFSISALNISGGTLAAPYTGLQLYLENGDLEVVPEPGTWALMLGGLALLVFIQRRRNKQVN
jgi:autotransporter-associated beta strand protein